MRRAGFTLAAFALVWTQTQEAPPRVEVRLAVERPGYEYVPAEPFVINVTLTNRGDTPREIPLELEPDYEIVLFYTRPAGTSEWRQFRPWALFENDANRTLAPNESVMVPARIFYGADGWTLPLAGTYDIYAAYGAERSNTISLRIVGPSPGEEARLSERALATSEVGRFLLLDGGDHLGDGLPLLRELAASNTRLSGYAANALGLSAAKPYINLRSGESREADLDDAARLLQQSRSQLPEGHFRLENYRALAETLRLMGRQPEALQLQQRYRVEIERAILEPAFRAHAQQIIRR